MEKIKRLEGSSFRSELFEELCQVMDRLRRECPWDKEQTLQSLTKYTIEELYELIEAIEAKNFIEVEKELGDLMFHIVFYAKIAQDKKLFDIESTLLKVIKKMKFRHPHIYSFQSAKTAQEVEKIWQTKKSQESTKGILSGVPKVMPNLVKAQRIQEKVATVGFDFNSVQETFTKLEEELEEFKTALKNNDTRGINQEFGDFIFSLVNLARKLGIDANSALAFTNRKFINRFSFLEKQIEKNEESIKEVSISKMNEYWEESKKHYR